MSVSGRRSPPMRLVLSYALLLAVVLLIALGFILVRDTAGSVAFGALFALLVLGWPLIKGRSV